MRRALLRRGPAFAVHAALPPQHAPGMCGANHSAGAAVAQALDDGAGRAMRAPKKTRRPIPRFTLNPHHSQATVIHGPAAVHVGTDAAGNKYYERTTEQYGEIREKEGEVGGSNETRSRSLTQPPGFFYQAGTAGSSTATWTGATARTRGPSPPSGTAGCTTSRTTILPPTRPPLRRRRTCCRTKGTCRARPPGTSPKGRGTTRRGATGARWKRGCRRNERREKKGFSFGGCLCVFQHCVFTRFCVIREGRVFSLIGRAVGASKKEKKTSPLSLTPLFFWKTFPPVLPQPRILHDAAAHCPPRRRWPCTCQGRGGGGVEVTRVAARRRSRRVAN